MVVINDILNDIANSAKQVKINQILSSAGPIQVIDQVRLNTERKRLTDSLAKVTKRRDINIVKARINQITAAMTDPRFKKVYHIFQTESTPIERLEIRKIKPQNIEADAREIYNPITLNYIKNSTRNRRRVEEQIKKHNKDILDKIEEVEARKNMLNVKAHLEMPVIGNDAKILCMKGKYIASITVKYSIFTNKDSEMNHKYIGTNAEDVCYELMLEKPKSRYLIADELVTNFFKFSRKGGKSNDIKNINNNEVVNLHDTGFDNISYDNLQINKWVENSFRQVLMKGKNLGYSLLNDTAIINEHTEGRCVPEFIYYECRKQNYLKRITLKQIISELDDIKQAIFCEDWNNQTELKEKDRANFMNRVGYDCRMIVEWAKLYKNISVHCIEPLFSEFLKHVPANKTSLNLCFILNNNHCYPITNPDIKHDIFYKHRIDMNKIKFKLNDYNGIYMDESQLNNFDNITESTRNKGLIYCGVNTLKNIVSKIITETNLIDGALSMSGEGNICKIIGYKHPNNGAIFVASPNYGDINDTCNKLNTFYKTRFFDFKNQSWAKLGKDMLNFGWITPTPSVYSKKYLDVLNDYKISPYNTKIYEETHGDFETYDISRCYTKILLDNKENYPIFYLNDPEPYNGEDIQCGEYYVNRIFYLGGGTIKQRNGFYSSNLINYCLENKYITKQDITAKIVARFSIKNDYFKQLIETIYKIFPYSHPACKNLVNHLLGTFGIVDKKFINGCLTTSFDVACAIKMKEENDTTRVNIYNHENTVYFVRKYEEQKELQGHKPIWRHIIAGSIIELDKLYKKVVNKDTVILGYYTDSIKGYNFNKIEQVKNKYIGCILPENKKNIYGTYINDITENKQFKVENVEAWKTYNESEDLDFNKIVEMIKLSSCLVNGCAGSGKTELIKNIVDDKTLTLSFTNKASHDVLKSRGVEAQTIDSYFFKNAGDLPYYKLIKDGYNRIVIDEISMLGLEKFKILHKIKSMYPNFIINLFGDFNQCAAVDDININLLSENFVKDLTGGVQYVLKYKGTRYDMETYKQLEQFNDTGYMPDSWKHKTIKTGLYVNICKTTKISNNTRDRINEQCFKEFSKGKKTVAIDGIKWCVYMPIFARLNNRKYEIYNSQKYHIKSINNEFVILKEKEDKINIAEFIKIFSYGFCDSCFRYQGDTVNVDYNIYDVAIMSRNELYTSLSRCTDINNVHFQYTNKQFEQTKPTINTVLLNENNVLKIKTGYIYKIEFTSKNVYIGSTTRSIEQRFKEHKERPVSKQMKLLFENEQANITVVETVNYTNENYLLELEKKHIKSYNHLGEMLINVNHREDEEQLTYEPFNAVNVVEDTTTKYKILDNKEGVLRINHHNTNKLFKYGRGKYDIAIAKAIQYRLTLLQHDYDF